MSDIIQQIIDGKILLSFYTGRRESIEKGQKMRDEVINFLKLHTRTGGRMIKKSDLILLRQLFLERLTVDKSTHGKLTNQAIFNKDEGWACFSGTDLQMVMNKFDNAVKDYKGMVK